MPAAIALLRSLILLTSVIMVLGSGHALAEAAGRVNFVTGNNVVATAGNGLSRTLQRGDVVNGGDRIETHSGRIQVRFSDGGFVSLQPNSAFGVDQYLYANQTPEESSLLFSLLRGGMRTITGAIGKVNKQSYRLRTPVATIGIRGTGFRVETNGSNLLLSIGQGFVNVTNSLGSITGGAGQNIKITNAGKPVLSGESVETRAKGAGGESKSSASDDASSEDESTSTPPPIATLVDDKGMPLILSNLPLPNSQAPVYLFAGSSVQSPGQYLVTPMAARINQKDGALMGLASVTTLIDSNTGAKSVNETVLFNAGNLHFNGITTQGLLSWGEYTAGQASVDTLHATPLNLNTDQFASYVFGIATGDTRPNTGVISYKLHGGTTPRRNQTGAGSLDDFWINLDLATATLDLGLKVSFDGETYNSSADHVSYVSQGTTVGLGFIAKGLLTSSSGSTCGPTLCYTDIAGFFAGPKAIQLGAEYDIFTPSGTLTGSAGLDRSNLAPSPSTLAPILVSSSNDSPHYFMVGASLTAAGTTLSSGLSARFDPSAARRGGLLNLTNAGGITLFDAGSIDADGNYAGLQFNDVKTQNGLSWGEFTAGTAITDTIHTSKLNLTTGQYVPYIIGIAGTPPVTTNIASYVLEGGSSPRLNQTRAGSLDDFWIKLNISLAKLDLGLKVTLAGESFTATATNAPYSALAQGFMINGLGTTSSGSRCANASCSTNLTGFFSNSALGTSYDILLSPNDTISGVASLVLKEILNPAPVVVANPPITPPVTPPLLATLADTDFSNVPATPVYTFAAPIYPDGATFLYPTMGASFDQGSNLSKRGGLLTLKSLDGQDPNPVKFSAGTLQYNNVTTANSLSWGELTNGTALQYSLEPSGTMSLTSNQFTPYIIGPSAPKAAIPSTGKASYTLLGNTLPRRQSDGLAGTLDSLSLAINFDFALLDVMLDVSVGGVSAHAAGSNIAFNTLAAGYFASNGISTSGTACVSVCSTDIQGFLAGPSSDQLGIAYGVNTLSDKITGVAAFSQNSPTTAAATLNNADIYTLTGGSIADTNGYLMLRGDSSAGVNASFDTNGGLLSATHPNQTAGAVLAGTNATEVGTNKTLSWGRYTSGIVTVDGIASTTPPITNLNSTHYIIGQETPAALLLLSDPNHLIGTATYSLANATTPTSPTGTGTLSNTSKLTVNFTTAELGVSLVAVMPAATYSVIGNVSYSGAQFTASGVTIPTTSSTSSCLTAGCTTSIAGFFSGQQAQQIGLSYKITEASALVANGVADFARGAITP